MFAGAESSLFQKAVQLRKSQTPSEDLLWGFLRTKPLGYKFLRQHPFKNYILDFYCHSLELAIEVDGSIHNMEDIKANDALRQNALEQYGLIVLRFRNEEINNELEKVIRTISNVIEQRKINSYG